MLLLSHVSSFSELWSWKHFHPFCMLNRGCSLCPMLHGYSRVITNWMTCAADLYQTCHELTMLQLT